MRGRYPSNKSWLFTSIDTGYFVLAWSIQIREKDFIFDLNSRFRNSEAVIRTIREASFGYIVRKIRWGSPGIGPFWDAPLVWGSSWRTNDEPQNILNTLIFGIQASIHVDWAVLAIDNLCYHPVHFVDTAMGMRITIVIRISWGMWYWVGYSWWYICVGLGNGG